MSKDVSRAVHQAIGLPDSALELWSDETSATEAGPAAGIPVPTAATQLGLTASGPQTAAVQVRTQTGGVPTLDATAAGVHQGSTMLIKPTASGDWYGWDPPYALRRWEAVERSTGAPEYVRHPTIAACEDGTVIVVAEVRDSRIAAQYALRAYIRDPATHAWSDVDIDGQTAALGGLRCPAVVVLPSGRVHVYEWVDDLYVRLWYSDDQGATWSHGGDTVNDYEPPTSSTIERCRVAYSRGQLCMVVEVDDSGQKVMQYASSDLGLTFQRVKAADAGTGGAGLCTVTSAPSGGFVIAMAEYESTSGAQAYVLADAYAPWDDSAAVTIGSTISAAPGGISAADGDLSLTTDETGIIYCHARLAQQHYAALSYDGGNTWYDFRLELFVGAFPTTGDQMDTYATCMQRGRVIMAHLWSAGTASWAATLGAAYLGGYTTATLPAVNITQSDRFCVGWRHKWLPIELPQNAGWTAAGAGTEALTATTGDMTVTTSGVQVRTYARTPDTPDGAIRFVVKPTSATVGHQRVTYSNGTLQVSARLGAASWELWDDVAGSIIGSGQVGSWSTSGIEIWIELDTSQTAVQSFYRVPSTSELATWTAGPSSTGLTTGSPTAVVRWGHEVGHAATSTWYELVYHDTADRTARALPATRPNGLKGRAMAGIPYVAEGAYVQARGGPSWRGEQWDIPTRAQYRAANLLTPSPRIPWRSTSVAAQTLALRWDDSGDTYGQTRMLALVLRDSNIAAVTVSYYASSAWTSLGMVQIGPRLLSVARSGRSVIPASGGTRLYLHHGEYADATMVMDYGGVSETSRRIEQHGEGAWDAAFPLRPTIRLRGDMASVPTSDNTTAIVPTQAVILIDLTGLAAQGVRIVTAGITKAESYDQIGTITPLWVYPLGQPYAWGRALATEANVQRFDTRDSITTTVRLSPPRRRAELGWDPVDQTAVETHAGLPDWLALSTTTEAGASAQGTAHVLEGIVRQVDGPAGVVGYFPHIPKMGGRLAVLDRRRDVIIGRITSAASATTVVGDEHVDEVVTPGSMVIEEEV